MKREEYMDNTGDYDESGRRNEARAVARHRAYHAQYVVRAHKEWIRHRIGLDRLMKSTNIHFNDIPLAEWDALCAGPFPCNGKLMRENGDYLTKAGAVCILKEAARQMVEAEEAARAKRTADTEQWLEIPAFLRRGTD